MCCPSRWRWAWPSRSPELDLVSLDEDTPRLPGLGLPRARLGFLVAGVPEGDMRP